MKRRLLLYIAVIAIAVGGLAVRDIPLLAYGYPPCIDCIGRKVLAEVWMSKCGLDPLYMVLDYLLKLHVCTVRVFTYPLPLDPYTHVTPMPELLYIAFGRYSLVVVPSVTYITIFLTCFYLYTRRWGIRVELCVALLLLLSYSLISIERIGLGNIDDTCIGAPLLVASLLAHVYRLDSGDVRRLLRFWTCETALLFLASLFWKGSILYTYCTVFTLPALFKEGRRRRLLDGALTLSTGLLPLAVCHYLDIALMYAVLYIALLSLTYLLDGKARIQRLVILLIPVTILVTWLVAPFILPGFSSTQLFRGLTPLRSLPRALAVGEELPPSPLGLASSISTLPIFIALFYVETVRRYESAGMCELCTSLLLTALLASSLSYQELMLPLLLLSTASRSFVQYLSRLCKCGRARILVPTLLVAPVLAQLRVIDVVYIPKIAMAIREACAVGALPRNVTYVVDSWGLGYFLVDICKLNVTTSPLTIESGRILATWRLIYEVNIVDVGQVSKLLEEMHIRDVRTVTIVALIHDKCSRDTLCYVCMSKNTTPPNTPKPYTYKIGSRTILCIAQLKLTKPNTKKRQHILPRKT